jgi:hypothetical protein
MPDGIEPAPEPVRLGGDLRDDIAAAGIADICICADPPAHGAT